MHSKAYKNILVNIIGTPPWMGEAAIIGICALNAGGLSRGCDQQWRIDKFD